MRKFIINVNGASYEVEVEEVEEVGAASSAAVSAPAPAPVAAPAPTPAAAPAAAPAPAPAPAAPPAGAETVSAPMPGNIVAVKVSVGQSVNAGDILCVLEAMKMENEIMAPKAGKVVAVSTSAGATVNTGDPLVSLG